MAIPVECSHCRHVNVVDAQPQRDYCCERCRSPLGFCPQCCQPRSAGAVICLQCGLDFRTGKTVVASPEPQHFGDFSIYPMLPGEWLLSIRRRVLGIPVGTREFQVAGFDKVYYDTVDSWTRNVSPAASPGTTSFSLVGIFSLVLRLLELLASLCLAMHYRWRRWNSSDDSQIDFFFFEAGLLGPHDRFLRLKQSPDSAEIRVLAEWLAGTLGLPIMRRDRRSPE